MAKFPETKFKERVIKDLKRLPRVWVLKTQERGRRGIPDLLVSLSGTFLAIELKAPGQKPDALQKVTLENIQAAGGMAFWTTPDEWPAHLSHLTSHLESLSE